MVRSASQAEADALSAVRAVDAEVANLIDQEERRQAYTLMLIPSENHASLAVRQAQGSVLTNKYAEGYPKRRYYQGNRFVDSIEALCIERAKSLFGAEHANVQPHAGASANMAVFLALLKPGDGILGLSLPHGGHLTHGTAVNFSGQLYRTIEYEVDEVTQTIDYDVLLATARREKPRIIIAGATAYPRQLDFERFRRIADEVGAYLLADIAHIAGLVAAGVHPSPIPFADVVTFTTHKTLRGPRGAMILCKKEHARAIDRAVFPGLQGGPFEHAIAAKAVALREAAEPSFKVYGQQVIENARELARELIERGHQLVSGGTDTHLVLIDLRATSVTGKQAALALERVGIVLNKNTVPFDPLPPAETSGLRLGTPAATTRGMGTPDMRQIGAWIDQTLKAGDAAGDSLAAVREGVESLCERFWPETLGPLPTRFPGEPVAPGQG
ncbi:MAG TPA: serine hydroxymethyltransferase [Chloroflexota bacterium]|nr:serine hydroxymethyltransferase [Chloroflexota bacterium]